MSVNRENNDNPHSSSPPPLLLIESRIETIDQSELPKEMDEGVLLVSTDHRRSPCSSLSSALDGRDRHSHQGAKKILSDHRSISNATFSTLRNNNNNFASIWLSSEIRRSRQRCRSKDGSNSSLTSLSMHKGCSFHNGSGSSLCSFSPFSTSLEARSSSRREKSRSLESLRDKRSLNLKHPNSYGSSSGVLRKNHTFASVASLRKRDSSGCFSQASSSKESSCNSSGSNISWSSKDVVQMAQRSNAASIKGVIDDLQSIIDESELLAIVKDLALEDEYTEEENHGEDSLAAIANRRGHNHDDDLDNGLTSWLETVTLQQLQKSEKEGKSAPAPPLSQCTMLAQWARVDAYYKVVITKYHGIPTVIRAMNAFVSCEEIQASCCVTLANLTNKVQVFQEGGVEAILMAMKEHPDSVDVQSAALEALIGIMPLIQHFKEQDEKPIPQIQILVKRTKDMFLTQDGKEAAMKLLEMIDT